MKFQIYQSVKDKGWRWRLVADNGRTIADQAEGDGYKRIESARKGIAAVRTGALNASLEVVKE